MTDNDLFDRLIADLKTRWSGLPDKPAETPDSTLRSLWLFVAGRSGQEGILEKDDLPELTSMQAEHLAALVETRISGRPLAYITGRQVFMGMEFLAGPEAMIPREETEILARAALKALKELVGKRKQVRLLDLCTGSGNLALLLAREDPVCRVTALDISPDALDLARRNAEIHGLLERVELIQGDLFEPLKTRLPGGKFDLIVCNPPYVSSPNVEKMPDEISKHEPRQAFDGGAFGFNLPWRLIKEAPQFMDEGSWLCFEIGLGQGRQMLAALEKTSAYRDVEPHLDQKGEIRAFSARAVR